MSWSILGVTKSPINKPKKVPRNPIIKHQNYTSHHMQKQSNNVQEIKIGEGIYFHSQTLHQGDVEVAQQR